MTVKEYREWLEEEIKDYIEDKSFLFANGELSMQRRDWYDSKIHTLRYCIDKLNEVEESK